MAANILEDKFWRRVLPLSCGCWVWTGCEDKDGYGFVRHEYKNLKTHRVSYELHKGSAQGKLVCHSCDIPSCVNPKHLFLGTAFDNAKDRDLKGRSGIEKRRTKLDYEELHRLRASGLTQQQIANALGSSRSVIGRALREESYHANVQ